MSGADIKLYQRMRGIYWGLLGVGVFGLPVALMLALTIPSQLKIFSDATIESIGGTQQLATTGFGIAGLLGLVAAVVMGATAGSVDLQRGVLRDLVLTGRSRPRIVIGRLLAVVVMLVVVLAASFGLTAILAAALAPVSTSADWETVARSAAQFLPSIAYTVPFAAGIALLVGSRGPAIAVYFVFSLLVDNVLAAIPKVGDAWQHVSLSRADQQLQAWITGGDPFFDTDRDVWQAAVVLAGWGIATFVVGLIRFSRRDL